MTFLNRFIIPISPIHRIYYAQGTHKIAFKLKAKTIQQKNLNKNIGIFNIN